MNEGVKILLERMKTNPEEFDVGYSTKWQQLIIAYREILEPEDKKALDDALNKLLQQTFTEKVMKELLAPEEDDNLGKWFTKRPNATLSAGVTPAVSSITLNTNANTVYNGGAVTGTIGANSLTLGNTTINEETLKHIQAHKTYLDAQKQKPHKTLFGKLFNYS